MIKSVHFWRVVVHHRFVYSDVQCAHLASAAAAAALYLCSMHKPVCSLSLSLCVKLKNRLLWHSGVAECGDEFVSSMQNNVDVGNLRCSLIIVRAQKRRGKSKMLSPVFPIEKETLKLRR